MSKSDARFELRLPSELLRQLDAARGDESRAGFVKRALESALSRGGEVPGLAGPVTSQPPAVVEEKDSRQRHQATQSRAPAACSECGAVGRMHQRGCSKGAGK